MDRREIGWKSERVKMQPLRVCEGLFDVFGKD